MHIALRRTITGVVAFGVVGVIAFVVAVGVEHTVTTILPAPTGPYAVGRAVYDWGDDPGLAAPAARGTRREVLAWIWYPAAAGDSAGVVEYLPAQMRAAVDRSRGPIIGTFLTRDLAKVAAHSLRMPAVSQRERAYPVVLMRGGASAEVWNYTILAEDLASHGYVVVGIDVPYVSNVVAFPDGRVMRRAPANDPELVFGATDSARRIDAIMAAWTSNMAFALDRLRQLNDSAGRSPLGGRLDLGRVGVFGHSLGGAEAAQFCHDDPRCTAGIDVDGAPLGSAVRDGIPRPFMFLLGGHANEPDRDSRHIEADIQAIYDRLPKDARLRVEIRGAYHFGFSDDGAVIKSHILLRSLRTLGIVGMDGRRQLEVTAYCIRSFFDAQLKRAGPGTLRLDSASYPEIQVLP